MPKKSWTDKLNDPTPPSVKPAPIDIAGMRAGEIMLVPTPRLIDDFIRELPAGRDMDVRAMRKALAAQHGAEVTCPIYTGFHLRTIAEAAFEAHERGAPLAEITPFWRVIDSKSPTASRLACGLAFIRTQRKREGLVP